MDNITYTGLNILWKAERNKSLGNRGTKEKAPNGAFSLQLQTEHIVFEILQNT